MKSGVWRLVILGAIVAVGALAILRRGGPAPPGPPRLTFVATAHQLGIVGYRDPVGAISPDGAWIAYSEGRFLRVRPTAGGPVLELPAATSQIRYLAWMTDSQRVLVEDAAADRRWWEYDLTARSRRPLWPSINTVSGQHEHGEPVSARVDDFRQLAWSPDGRSLAGLVNNPDGNELWVVSSDGHDARVRRITDSITSVAWAGASGQVGCIAARRLSQPCGDPALDLSPSIDLYGPLAFTPDGGTAYAGVASAEGTLDLCRIDLSSRRWTRVTGFSRDTYQPSLTRDGALVFKVQTYRTHVADSPAAGGPVRVLATFQSETPSWDPTGRVLAVTYGSWRRIIDDANYPDIAQDIGLINLDGPLPAARPSAVVAQSPSEDQAMAWSPNGRWIALHSHRDMSDDVWLRASDGRAPDRRISFLGRGAETGWPRWSSDGRWVLFTARRRSDQRSVMYVIGVDQTAGAVTAPPAEIAVAGQTGAFVAAEWLPDSARVMGLALDSPGQQTIVIVDRRGGVARTTHRFASEHGFPGLAVSPDGRSIAFVAPAADGFFQIHRMPTKGGPVTQVTSDPSNKSQPSWSPDGQRLAFTAWSYDAEFWMVR